MKKVVIVIGSLIVLIFTIVIYMANNDESYIRGMKKKIIKNTDIVKIDYVNKYDGYYIVKDKEYLYLIDSNYNILIKKDLILVHKNDKNYDIIYKNDSFMYMHDYLKKDSLVIKYYDISTYKLIDTSLVGG